MRRILVALFVALVSVGAGMVFAGTGPVGPLECPDYDNDGICNGLDPDYVPGDECTGGLCPNPDCPDADADGICNGQDPDYTPPGGEKKIMNMFKIMLQSMFGYCAVTL